MINAEKSKRIRQAILETYDLLGKAQKKYQDSLICLKMEIEENRELGNDDSANNHAREYVEERKVRVIELENHILRLEKMLQETEGKPVTAIGVYVAQSQEYKDIMSFLGQKSPLLQQ